MSFRLPGKATRASRRSRWAGTAFLIEAMLLVIFLMMSLTVFVRLFGVSLQRARQAEDLAQAVSMATNMAERFAAHPDEGAWDERGGESGSLRATCVVVEEPRAGGVLYHATIDVYAEGSSAEADDPLYSLSTAAYVSGVHANA